MDDDVLTPVMRAIDAFEEAMSHAHSENLSGLIPLRVDLAKAVNAFFAAEQKHVPDPMLKIVDAVSEDDRQNLFDAFTSLRREYSLHIAKWDKLAIERDWRGYRAGSASLIADMRKLLERRSTSMRKLRPPQAAAVA